MKPARQQEQSLIDAWLRREFKSRYDAALDEPIPDELASLLSGSPNNR